MPEDATMTKHQKVLYKSSVHELFVSFDADKPEMILPEDEDWTTLEFSREAFDDMGQPETITVTIEPGDKLNA